MSDGTLRALAALTAVFQIIPPHGPPSLVAIEEPETGLHPSAMQTLLSAFDEATLRTQMLITTHSPSFRRLCQRLDPLRSQNADNWPSGD
jgi:predicted ATPase